MESITLENLKLRGCEGRTPKSARAQLVISGMCCTQRKWRKSISVALPAQMSPQMEGTPLATQQSVWSRPSKRHPAMNIKYDEILLLVIPVLVYRAYHRPTRRRS